MRIPTVEDRESVAIILAQLFLKGRTLNVERESFVAIPILLGTRAATVYNPQGCYHREDDRHGNSSAQSNLQNS